MRSFVMQTPRYGALSDDFIEETRVKNLLRNTQGELFPHISVSIMAGVSPYHIRLNELLWLIFRKYTESVYGRAMLLSLLILTFMDLNSVINLIVITLFWSQITLTLISSWKIVKQELSGTPIWLDNQRKLVSTGDILKYGTSKFLKINGQNRALRSYIFDVLGKTPGYVLYQDVKVSENQEESQPTILQYGARLFNVIAIPVTESGTVVMTTDIETPVVLQTPHGEVPLNTPYAIHIDGIDTLFVAVPDDGVTVNGDDELAMVTLNHDSQYAYVTTLEQFKGVVELLRLSLEELPFTQKGINYGILKNVPILAHVPVSDLNPKQNES